MAGYKDHGETIILINGDDGIDMGHAVVVNEDLVSNPKVTMPLGDYEYLRVKTALVRSADYDKKKSPKITDSQSAYKVVRDSTVEPQECMYILLLDAQNKLIGIHELSRGGGTSMAVEPSKVFQAAIVANAVSMILAHNHPSGSSKPSPEDIELSREIYDLGERLGFRMLDSLVVGHNSYTSLADEGLL